MAPVYLCVRPSIRVFQHDNYSTAFEKFRYGRNTISVHNKSIRL
jgi:hypothetical protein